MQKCLILYGLAPCHYFPNMYNEFHHGLVGFFLTEGYLSEQHQKSIVAYMRHMFAPGTENATVQHILKGQMPKWVKLGSNCKELS